MFVDDKKLGEQQTETTEPWRLILLKAADLIEQCGHCKNAVVDSTGAMCMGGAINMADTGNPFTVGCRSEAGEEAAQQLHKFCRYNFVVYNNARLTTAADAVEKLRACAHSR